MFGHQEAPKAPQKRLRSLWGRVGVPSTIFDVHFGKNRPSGVSSKGRGSVGEAPGGRVGLLAPWQSDQIALAGFFGAVVEFRRFRLSPNGSKVLGRLAG